MVTVQATNKRCLIVQCASVIRLPGPVPAQQTVPSCPTAASFGVPCRFLDPTLVGEVLADLKRFMPDKDPRELLLNDPTWVLRTGVWRLQAWNCVQLLVTQLLPKVLSVLQSQVHQDLDPTQTPHQILIQMTSVVTDVSSQYRAVFLEPAMSSVMQR